MSNLNLITIKTMLIKGAFVDNSLNKAKPVCDKNGLPILWHGAQCAVAKMGFPNGNTKALRFWFSETSEMAEIYNAISVYFELAPAPYILNLKYMKNAVTFNSIGYSALLMDWCNGKSLKNYIADHLKERESLCTLAQNIDRMFRDMNTRGISHGDIHHENIIIKEDSQPYLIDYDSFYVPQLTGHKDYCLGYSGYQLPLAREHNDFLSNKTDFFSQLIIMLTLECLIAKPNLWLKYMDDDDYSLIFKKEDFLSLSKSEIYNDIKNLGGKISNLLDTLKQYLKESDIDALWPYYEAKNYYHQRSNFCIICGHPRYHREDHFCNNCGNKLI